MNTSTKVICTIGPASWTPDMMAKLQKAGMAIARFNFCHIVKAEQVQAARKLGLAVMLDSQGPDVRIGLFKDGKITVNAGQTFKFYFGEKNKGIMGDENGVYVPYEKLLKIVKKGSKLALNDGHVVMEVTEIKDNIITAKVIAGGVLKDRKSLAAPGYDLQLPFISPEDEADFLFGIENKMDWVAASAVMKPQDVIDLREFLKKHGGEKMKIMSKIEDRIGVSNIDKIIELSDAIMVARGGLGTDIGLENLPPTQKMLVAKTRKAGKIAVVATEMLESMTDKPNCTRAEASDVANAVWDGANFVMLSGETAAGKYPVECVEFMYRTIAVAEKHKEYFRK